MVQAQKMDPDGILESGSPQEVIHLKPRTHNTNANQA